MWPKLNLQYMHRCSVVIALFLALLLIVSAVLLDGYYINASSALVGGYIFIFGGVAYC